jgi:hypothetical protein
MRNAFGGVLGRQTRLLAGLAAAAVLAVPSLAVAAELDGGETFISLGHVVVPGQPLQSFDISWIDEDLNLYLLADRSNSSIDIVPIIVNPPVFKIVPTGANAFAGNVPAAACGGQANVCSGPNGILTINNPNPAAGKELWVGDGPTMNPVCASTCSTVKVFNSAAVQTHTISTGGSFRADELCFAPPGPGHPNGLILIANDADAPPFVSFIPTDGPNAYTVIAKISFPQATNGIEQCQWDPQTGVFYLNLPEVSGPGNDTVPGNVVFISPVTMSPFAFVPVPINECAGPQGMAIGPRPGTDILLGCFAPTIPSGLNNSVIINDFNGLVNTVLVGQGGADQVSFDDIGGQHYFLPNGALLPAQSLGITDARTRTIDQNIFVGFTGGTTRRVHSLAGWSGSPIGLGTSVTAVIMPVPQVGGTPLPPFTSSLCGADALAGCITFFGTIPIPTNASEALAVNGD